MDFFAAGMILASYVSGGVPTGFFLARALKGIDIREHGSGNPGAANVYRVVGPVAGLATLAFDAAKGFAPVFLAARFAPEHGGWLPAACGGAAIVGHDWSPFLGFGGGKGVATTAGVFAALCPKALLVSYSAFVAGALLTEHISVGSMAASGVFPLAAAAAGADAATLGLAAPAALLILYRHVPNIESLRTGRPLAARPKASTG
ncbi:glycerol-3-phosphate acyltransferase [bacterium]|nr:MAG: glycerol-3-phosphate acyltransferase [bacterium]